MELFLTLDDNKAEVFHCIIPLIISLVDDVNSETVTESEDIYIVADLT